MSCQPSDIHLQPLGGQGSDASLLQGIFVKLKALGSLFIDNCPIDEFPGSVLVGMLCKDGSMIIVQHVNHVHWVHIEMRTYYPDGFSFTVFIYPDAEELLHNPQHPGGFHIRLLLINLYCSIEIRA